MKTINVIVEWSDKNFCGGYGDKELGAVLATGATLEDFKRDFEEALDFHIEGMVEHGDAPEWAKEGSYEIVYQMEVSAVLRQAVQYTTMAAVSRVSGINQKLLEHYASSRKHPRQKQQDKIREALHKIGNEILAFS